MKKIVVLLLFVFTFSLHSFEWGGILNESISNSKESYTEDSFLFTHKNCLDLWVQTPIAQKENLSFMFKAAICLTVKKPCVIPVKIGADRVSPVVNFVFPFYSQRPFVI